MTEVLKERRKSKRFYCKPNTKEWYRTECLRRLSNYICKRMDIIKKQINPAIRVAMCEGLLITILAIERKLNEGVHNG